MTAPGIDSCSLVPLYEGEQANMTMRFTVKSSGFNSQTSSTASLGF